ncbi:hypothetical protein [Erysipelothrix tonsillarum]|nr:hypothetical protein [Erysipelothrix tonsillarum]
MKKTVQKAIDKANQKPPFLLAAGLIVANVVLMAIVKQASEAEEA